jgi:hypothetical protein
MVRPDQLYQVHQRLMEIKCCDELYGGVAVVVVGDLMQLRPVFSDFVFGIPVNAKNIAYHVMQPLWPEFHLIELTTNHRQGAHQEFAQIMSRLRYSESTEDDFLKFETRIIRPNMAIPPDALQIFGSNAAAGNANMLRSFKCLDGPEIKISASKIPPSGLPNYSCKIGADGSADATPYLNVLHLKVNARVIITHNINTEDKLINGQRGTVVHIHVNNTSHKVDYIIVQPDDPNAGQLQQQKHPRESFPFHYANRVPIFIRTHHYSIGKSERNHAAKATVKQFPLRLAWAITCHKVQGQTVKEPQKVGVGINTLFDSNQAYVAMTRVQSMDQLFFYGYKRSKIYCHNVAKKEALKLSQVSFNNNPNMWFNNDPSLFRISTLTIRSLNAHIKDLQHDYTLMQSQVIALTETWVDPFEAKDKNSINGFKMIDAAVGRGKGVRVYADGWSQSMTVSDANFQAVRITNKVDIITIYASSSMPKDQLVQEIKALIRPEAHRTIIMGDFKWDALTTQTPVTQFLTNEGFRQLVQEPTHRLGSCLDHIYFRDPAEYVQVQPCYYSDHDSVCIVLKLT